MDQNNKKARPGSGTGMNSVLDSTANLIVFSLISSFIFIFFHLLFQVEKRQTKETFLRCQIVSFRNIKVEVIYG